ncbi:hypothetical protein QJS66_00290 [Kocuria rhizophila]|nr:hypothetical protein QJS66_00290 [Kocuria rhizophila]
MPAFAMFASDLDAASRQQLTRGERLMELKRPSTRRTREPGRLHLGGHHRPARRRGRGQRGDFRARPAGPGPPDHQRHGLDRLHGQAQATRSKR